MTTLEAAREYARAGFAVFPLRPGSKWPATKNGLHDATTDLHEIEELWSTGSEGIGLPLAANGLVAIDVDRPDALFDELRELLDDSGTARQVTDAENTQRAHYIFDAEGLTFSNSTESFPVRGWGDVRGVGYIVVEPTTHPSANASSLDVRENPAKYRPTAVYRFESRQLARLPAKLRGWLREARHSEVATSPANPELVDDFLSRYDEKLAPERLLRDLEPLREAIAAGEPRNEAIFRHAGNVLRGAIAGNYPARDAYEAVWGLVEYVEGREPHERDRFEEEMARLIARVVTDDDPQELRDRLAPFKLGTTIDRRRPDDEERGNRFARRALSRSQLARLPEPEPLIDNTLDRNTLALLAGSHGIGKSFVALDWAACVATGESWMGRRVESGRVLYVMGEGAFGVHQRLSAWETHRATVIPDERLVVLPESVQLADARARTEFIEWVEGERFDLVVVDTLARSAVGLDENSARDMGVFIDAAEQVKRATSGTVLLVHHTGKDKKTVRGSSALEAAMDTVYKVEGDPGSFKLMREKRKDGPRFDELTLRLVEVDASCVVQEIGMARVSLEVERSRLVDAYTMIANAHGDFAEPRSVLKDTLMEGGFGRTQAYEMIRRLAALDILRNVGTEKSVRLVIDKTRAAEEGFPNVEKFTLRTPKHGA